MTTADGHCLSLIELAGTFAVCKLDKETAIPAWATTGTFFSTTRTSEELSIVCPQAVVPDGIRCEREWRCLRIAGPLAFSLVGILSSLVTALAQAEVSVFAVSTFDTDYIFVKENDFEKSVAVLRAVGHKVQTEPTITGTRTSHQ